VSGAQLLEVVSVAIIARVVRITGSQAGSGAGAEPGLGELALDGHAPGSFGPEIDGGGARLAKVVDGMLGQLHEQLSKSGEYLG
jgi:hypothetical protein